MEVFTIEKEGKLFSRISIFSRLFIISEVFSLQGMAQMFPYQDSPFGIFGLYEVLQDNLPPSVSDIQEFLLDVGAKWVQEMYPFGGVDDMYQIGLNVYSRVGGEGGTVSPNPPSPTYKDELREVIRQYKDKVKYWEIGTEVEVPQSYGSAPQNYALLLQQSYEVIKEESPNSFVVFGGMALGSSEALQFLRDVLEAGGAGYFDALEFKHWEKNSEDHPLLKEKMTKFGEVLADYGIDIHQIPVLVETCTHDGDTELNRPWLKTQTEKEQAIGLLKIYVFGTANGIDKLF